MEAVATRTWEGSENVAAGVGEGVPGGIRIQAATALEARTIRKHVLQRLRMLDLDNYVTIGAQHDSGSPNVEFRLHATLADHWAPDSDTTGLCRELNLDTQGNADDLEREILLAMLVSPIPFDFPDHEELESTVRVRKNIVAAARKTSLAFDTRAAERPADCWTYATESGFTVRPGNSLISALQKATQPDESGRRYSFSCYRATEYVVLLGIAQELAVCNPDLLERLQHQWERRAIKSAEFHEIFMHEYGSMDAPLPLRYFVPGDRTWFRNPDDHSSDVTGYEGSWVIYHGNGLFTNFWERNQPYTLTAKCLELFHWRNATRRSTDGELEIDENIVADRVRRSLDDPDEIEEILRIMLRHREPGGVYVDGGCIDTSRECPRPLCPRTTNVRLTGH